MATINRIIKFAIIDASGKKKSRDLIKLFYKYANICILVYDITYTDSFLKIKNYWYNNVISNPASDQIIEIMSFFKNIGQRYFESQ